MPFVDLPGMRMHFEIDDRDPDRTRDVLVLSHSIGTTMSLWDLQWGALRQRFRLLRYDARGHGRSAVPPGPYQVQQLAEDVIALLDALFIRRAHFCGLSMGGVTGLWLGIYAPSRIDRIIIANSAAKIGSEELWDARIQSVQDAGMSSIADSVMARWFTAEFRRAEPARTESTRTAFLGTPVLGYANCCGALRAADLRSQIENIKLPALIISGSRDVATTTTEGRFMAQKISGARYLELDSAHLSNIEQSARFNRAVTDFLTGEAG